MEKIDKKENIKEKLLEQGVELVSEYGYHGTGLKKILDTVNVPKGSFYNYFQSKEKYVAEIIDFYSLNLFTFVDDILDKSEKSPMEKARYIHEIILEKIMSENQKGCLIGNLAAEIGNTSSICQESMKSAVDIWKNKFVILFKEAQEVGEIRSDLKPEVLFEIMWCTWQGGLLKMHIDGGVEHLKRIINVMFDKLFIK